MVSGGSTTVQVAGFFRDPDGDRLTYSVSTSDPNVVSAAVSDVTVTLTAIAKGTATVTVTATDPSGLAARQSFTASVPNQQPRAVGELPALEIVIGDSVPVDVASYFEDPDGDALTFEAETSDAAVATASASGSVVTAVAVDEGVATVTLTATDTDGLSVDREMTVTVVAPQLTIEDFISVAEVDGFVGTARPGTPPAEGDGPSVSLAVNSLDVINGGTVRSPVTADEQFTTLYVLVGGVTDESNRAREIDASLRQQAVAAKAIDPRLLRRSIAAAGDPVLVDGFFEIVLPAATRSVNLLLQFPQSLPSTAFDLILGAASSAGILGSFLSVPAAVTVVGTGDIQISLSWDSDADLDLHVVEPSGEEIYYGNSTSRTGGRLDLDSNRRCSSGPRNENVTWPSGRAPNGHYVVRVNHWSNCGASRTNYTVRVIAGEHSEIRTGSFTGRGNFGGRGAGITVTTFVFGSGAAVTITGTDPPVLLEGRTATITGFGFSPIAAENHVSIGGLDANVRAATPTTLSIQVPRSDCLPPRTAELRVTSPQGAATATASVSPRSRDDLELGRYWYKVTPAGNGCLHLPGNASGGEYLIGVASTSETAASLEQVVLTGTPGDPAVVAPDLIAGVQESGMASLAGPFDVRPDDVAAASTPTSLPGIARSRPTRNHAAHDEFMARSWALLEELGPIGPTPLARSMQADSLAVGDVVTLFVDPTLTCSVSKAKQVRAVVRIVGENTIWLDDVDNPHFWGNATGFTDRDLEELDAFYATHVRSVQDAYFGALSDVDGDGRVHVLMTKEVNNTRLAGWVSPADLRPSRCSTSNEAEIFYGFVPDPEGDFGQPRSLVDVLAAYPALLTHELTHLVQYNAFVPEDTPKTRWELEGGATLSEELVAYRLFGHGSGRNMGYEEYDDEWDGWPWYYSWFADLTRFFGLDPDEEESRRESGAPERCSWVGEADGPCGSEFRAVYGVPSVLLRWAMDRWSDDYPGGETALMRHLTQSPNKGFASLEEVSGWRIEQILAEFYLSLWADGHATGDGRVWNTIRSWDIRDIITEHYGSTSARLVEPHTSTSASPRHEAAVRAGSSLFFHWWPTPGESLAPTSIKVVSPTGGPVAPIFVWAWRLR